MKRENVAQKGAVETAPNYAAGYHMTPARLAAQRMRAVLAWLVGGTALGAGVVAALYLEHWGPGAAGALLGLMMAIYGGFVWRYTDRVVGTLWQQELAQARDLDGDGYVGPPSRDVRVRGAHGEAEPLVVDLPPGSARNAPILRPYGLSAADLVSLLFEAQTRGLQERRWVGPGTRVHVLPSGTRVTQSVFRAALKGLGRQGLARQVNGGRWELVCDPEVVARQLAEQS